MKRIKLDEDSIKQILSEIEQGIKLNYDRCDVGKDIKHDISKYLKISDAPKAKILFTPLAYLKMWSYVQINDIEIAWHCTVERKDKNIFVIKDAFLYPQKITSVTVETDDEKYAQWVDTLDIDTYNSMKMQCHSHVKMDVTPSGVDQTYYKNQLSDTADDSFYIFLIINKKHEVWCNIYDKENNIHYESGDIEFELVDNKGNSITEYCTKEIEDNCAEPVKATTTYEKKDDKGQEGAIEYGYTRQDYWMHIDAYNDYVAEQNKKGKDYMSYREYLANKKYLDK